MSIPLSITEENSWLLIRLRKQLLSIKAEVPDQINEAKEGIRLLASLQDSIGKNLVDDRYTSLVLEAVEWLNTKYKDRYPKMEWLWNSFSGDFDDEPNLIGTHEGVVVVSAAVAPYEKPVTQVSIYMGDMLGKLSRESEGEVYYFVLNERMEHHAQMKVDKMMKGVTVVNLMNIS